MSRFLTFGFLAVAFAALAGCAPEYSPNTYASNAVQQANKVEPGIVVGYREVHISASGTVGAVTGGAAGGILGSQADISGVTTALGTLSGTLVGGIVGTTIEHAAGDTTGWEYIVSKPNGELLSVTQREPTPIPIGQKVLVITGNQARVIADYSVTPPAPGADKDKAAAREATEHKDSTPSASSAPASLSAPASSTAPSPAATPSTSVAASPDGPPARPSAPQEAGPSTTASPAVVPADSSAEPKAASP